MPSALYTISSVPSAALEIFCQVVHGAEDLAISRVLAVKYQPAAARPARRKAAPRSWCGRCG